MQQLTSDMLSGTKIAGQLQSNCFKKLYLYESQIAYMQQKSQHHLALNSFIGFTELELVKCPFEKLHS